MDNLSAEAVDTMIQQRSSSSSSLATEKFLQHDRKQLPAASEQRDGVALRLQW